jgi:hypothetical protein
MADPHRSSQHSTTHRSKVLTTRIVRTKHYYTMSRCPSHSHLTQPQPTLLLQCRSPGAFPPTLHPSLRPFLHSYCPSFPSFPPHSLKALAQPHILWRQEGDGHAHTHRQELSTPQRPYQTGGAPWPHCCSAGDTGQGGSTGGGSHHGPCEGADIAPAITAGEGYLEEGWRVG